MFDANKDEAPKSRTHITHMEESEVRDKTNLKHKSIVTEKTFSIVPSTKSHSVQAQGTMTGEGKTYKDALPGQNDRAKTHAFGFTKFVKRNLQAYS